MESLQSFSRFMATEVEAHLKGYSRLQVLLGTAVGTWLLLRLVEVYEDGDCKAKIKVVFSKKNLTKSLFPKT